ncbi:ArsR/SmtB family transcription factor [Peptostreptococcus faecalis]|uniref:ArsR/SmtB family transcription factor n=1 Tax=Peptostreptococcus faecalis TaxID=2045015 RepID=UPI000C7C20DB|nr:metalloregulator ArsR/SmtB family transcription factor [Peptostreptococcus faecalis]
MEEKAKEVAEILKLLSNENRLLMFCALMEGPMSVSDIAKKIPNITSSAISQHLSLLKAHKILDSSKNGQTVTYFIADERVNEIINTVKKFYC